MLGLVRRLQNPGTGRSRGHDSPPATLHFRPCSKKHLVALASSLQDPSVVSPSLNVSVLFDGIPCLLAPAPCHLRPGPPRSSLIACDLPRLSTDVHLDQRVGHYSFFLNLHVCCSLVANASAPRGTRSILRFRHYSTWACLFPIFYVSNYRLGRRCHPVFLSFFVANSTCCLLTSVHARKLCFPCSLPPKRW